MRRVLILTLVASTLSLAAFVARGRLETIRASTPRAELLYLPKGPFLRAMALGHEETLADLLYIWSIQYYSNYDDASRYDYLSKIYNDAITELDPHFTEVYLVGAMIMSWEAKRPELALALYDKALRAMPENWEVAYWAGWECYYASRYQDARRYWSRAARSPGAPPQLIRLAARTLERSGSLEDAIAEYRWILADPPDERSAIVVSRWLRHTERELVLTRAQQALARLRTQRQGCPPELEQLLASSDLPSELREEAATSLIYDASECTLRAAAGDALEEER